MNSQEKRNKCVYVNGSRVLFDKLKYSCIKKTTVTTVLNICYAFYKHKRLRKHQMSLSFAAIRRWTN